MILNSACSLVALLMVNDATKRAAIPSPRLILRGREKRCASDLGEHDPLSTTATGSPARSKRLGTRSPVPWSARPRPGPWARGTDQARGQQRQMTGSGSEAVPTRRGAETTRRANCWGQQGCPSLELVAHTLSHAASRAPEQLMMLRRDERFGRVAGWKRARRCLPWSDRRVANALTASRQALACKADSARRNRGAGRGGCAGRPLVPQAFPVLLLGARKPSRQSLGQHRAPPCSMTDLAAMLEDEVFASESPVSASWLARESGSSIAAAQA